MWKSVLREIGWTWLGIEWYGTVKLNCVSNQVFKQIHSDLFYSKVSTGRWNAQVADGGRS